jgi:hypothetical protein
MLNSEIIAVCSQIHTKHINTLCGQNVNFLNVKPELLRVKFVLFVRLCVLALNNSRMASFELLAVIRMVKVLRGE